jgi:anti-anti-sigma factor
MTLDTQLIEEPKGTVLKLIGQLDSVTAPLLSPLIAQLQNAPPKVLILELQDLNYISSAGLRCVFQLKKLMKNENGRFVISQPSPQVRKVFDIVKAVPLNSIFSSVAELDEYLDHMQRKVSEDL